MDKKAILAILVLWVLIALFKCTQPETNLAPNEGCEVLAHFGIMPQWVEGGKFVPTSSKACWWETASELKSLLLVASNKVVVMGHGRMTFAGDDSIIGGEVTYNDLRRWKREGQVVAAFSCRGYPFFSPKEASHKPFMEDGLMVWVEEGVTLLSNPRLAYGEAFGYRKAWGF